MTWRVFLRMSILIIVCTACESTLQDAPSPSVVSTIVPAAAFLRLQPGLQLPEPLALTSGVLTVHDRCIRLMNADDPRGYAVIWNDTMTFDGTTVRDLQTSMQTQLGNTVTVGGGVVGHDYIAHLANPTDNPCTPPFWFATHIPPVRK